MDTLKIDWRPQNMNSLVLLYDEEMEKKNGWYNYFLGHPNIDL